MIFWLLFQSAEIIPADDENEQERQEKIGFIERTSYDGNDFDLISDHR